MFKSIDNKIKKLGFIKIKENEHIIIYERFNTKYNYTQHVAIAHKIYGKPILQSYDKELFDTKKIGNTCVGLTYQEAKLFLKKMKRMELKNRRKIYEK